MTGEILDQLRAADKRFAVLFDSENPRPLPIGFHKLIRKRLPDRTSNAIAKALRAWCSRIEYVHAVAADGSRRYGLNRPVGDVSDKERRHAQRRLERLERVPQTT